MNLQEGTRFSLRAAQGSLRVPHPPRHFGLNNPLIVDDVLLAVSRGHPTRMFVRRVARRSTERARQAVRRPGRLNLAETKMQTKRGPLATVRVVVLIAALYRSLNFNHLNLNECLRDPMAYPSVELRRDFEDNATGTNSRSASRSSLLVIPIVSIVSN